MKKDNVLLTVSSLVSIVLWAFHLADDIMLARPGTQEAGASNLVGIAILAVWLLGTVFSERRLGLVVTLLGSLFAAGMPVLHWWGKTEIVGPRLLASGHAYFFTWTLLMLGTLGTLCFVLSARGLWSSLRRGRPAKPTEPK